MNRSPPMGDAAIVASGDLDEPEFERLVEGGAPVAVWGVGTELGTSRDSPAVGGVYKLVAERLDGAGWRGVAKAARPPRDGVHHTCGLTYRSATVPRFLLSTSRRVVSPLRITPRPRGSASARRR